jgi:transcription antitermination factor NusG
LVSFDNEPASVPDEVIAALDKTVERLNRQTRLGKHGLQHGDPVRILEGPFKGYPAIFDTRIQGSDRVRLLVKLMRGQQKKVQVPAEMAAPKKP